MKDILIKIMTWIFLGPAINKSLRIDNILRVAIVNIIAMLGTCYIILLFTSMFLQKTDSVFYVVMAYISVFTFIAAFIVIHTNRGIEYFDIVKNIVILDIMLFYGLIYAKIDYGYIWSFLVPIMIIFLTDIFSGLLFCTCYFFFMLTMEFVFEINNWSLFGRHACIYWSQVIMASVYEALSMRYSKKLLRDKAKIEILSITDHLTKLYNRRYFSESMNREFARAMRQKESICFLMIDVDKFKDYNDTYGHLQGDELLVALADIFKRTIKRPGDAAFRMGGEEFGILLPNTDLNGAAFIAEKIRADVQNTEVPLLDGKGITKTTVSVGIACIFPKIGEISENLLKLADNNLYIAKKMGRNMVIG
ncbi:MAG: GGDEF domain-containing protein [Fibromonadaceae bacterium]|jgi:diguanylate cyclase (GGDEF)-like protein|nr:GGDEF domain-containing protein [Fibromonadaceae bacterium]